MTRRASSEGRLDLAEETFRPYRQLAVRVLALAFHDVANPVGAAADRDSARRFLRGSGMLVHWCRVAALDPGCIVRLAEKLGPQAVCTAMHAARDGGARQTRTPERATARSVE